MKTHLLKNVIIVLVLIQYKTINAQDIHFSQLNMAPLLVDPSNAGKFGGDIRAIINHRNQWRSFTDNPFKTYGAMVDMPLTKNKNSKNILAGGLSVYTDKAGQSAMNTTLFNASIAYHVNIHEGGFLSGGLQGGLIQRGINTSALRFDNQFDGNGHNSNLSSGEIFNNANFIKPDFGAGISYSWSDNTTQNVISDNGYQGKKVNVGAAVHHAISPNYSFINPQNEKLNLRYVTYAASSFGIQDMNIAIQPSVFVFYQKKANNVLLGSHIRYTLREQSKYTQIVKGMAVSLGGHLRVGDAFITSLLFETGSFAFGISYDVNTSGLKSVSRGMGAYEIAIRYISPNPFSARKSQSRFY